MEMHGEGKKKKEAGSKVKRSSDKYEPPVQSSV